MSISLNYNLFIYLFSNRSVQCWKSVQLAVKVGVHKVGKRGGICLWTYFGLNNGWRGHRASHSSFSLAQLEQWPGQRHYAKHSSKALWHSDLDSEADESYIYLLDFAG